MLKKFKHAEKHTEKFKHAEKHTETSNHTVVELCRHAVINTSSSYTISNLLLWKRVPVAWFLEMPETTEPSFQNW
jgi:hypothetical protein